MPLSTPLHLATAAIATTPPTGWRPFLNPMPIWDAWFWTLLPLALAIALVYKAIKTPDVGRIPRETAALTAWIVLGLIGAALGLAAVVHFA